MKARFVVPVLFIVTMLVVGLVPAWAGQPGSGTSYIYVQNADSGADAQVVAEFYNQDGTSAGSVNIASLAPYVSYTVNTGAVSPALPTGWNGSVVVSSDKQVAAVARTIYSGVPDAPDGLYAGDYTAQDTPALTSFLAYVFNGGNRNSIFSIQNTTGSDATVTIHYLRRSDGTEIPGGASCEGSPIVDTIPAYGAVYYDLLNQTRNGVYDGDLGGTIPCQSADGTTQPAAGTEGGFEGAIYIESDQEIIAASSTHWARFQGVYTGATTDDTFLYYPQLVRVKSPDGDWVRWSALIVQNTENFDVDIEVSLIGGPSSPASVTFTDTIPALSSVGYNTRFQGDFADDMWTNCSAAHGLEPDCWLEGSNGFDTRDWTGAATVEVLTSGGHVVGVNHVQYFVGRVFTYEALQPSTAGTTLVCPIFQDQDSGDNMRWSAAIVQNTSTSADATVDAYLFTEGNTTGGLAGADLTLNNGGAGYTVGQGERFGLNTRFDADEVASVFDPLGNDWVGSLVLVSRDEPIHATVSIFRYDRSNGKDFATDYNCYVVP